MPNWIPLISETDKRKVNGWVAKAPPGTMIAFKKHDARSIEQNALLWSWLTAISEQLPWHGEKLSPNDYKDILTAGLRQAHVVPGINEGTYVPLGLRTSSMSRSEMTALLELIAAFAAEHGVKLPDEEVAA
jgi:hypothetical protein